MDAKFVTTYISSLGRPLDPRHPSNILVMVVASVAFAAVLIASAAGNESLDIIHAVYLGAAVFLAWAITRELDPDHPQSANMSAFLVIPFVLSLGGEIGIIANFALLMIFRVVNRSTGLKPAYGELALFIGVAVVLGLTGDWLIGLAIALGFLMDARFPDAHHAALPLGVLTGVLALIAAAMNDQLTGQFALTGVLQWATLGTVVLVMRFMLPKIPDELMSHGDYKRGYQLSGRRLYLTVTLAALTLLIVGWVLGEDGIAAIAPLWASLISILVWWVLRV